MTEIYLDDYHLHSLTTDGLATKVDRGLSGLEAPEQRIDAYNNPGADGQTVANVLHGGRLITMEGRIRGADETTYRANRSVFHQLVGANRSALGQYSPRILKLTDATGMEYRLSVVVRSLKNPDELPTTSAWQLQLLATDFRIYGETETTTSITLPVSGGLAFPFSLPVSFGASSGGAGSITNQGTVATPPTIKFYGPMENPRLTNLTTGAVMGLDISLVSGDIITVDMAKRTIIQGETTNRMSTKTTDSKFWMLEPGVNTLSLSATSYDEGYATITYRSAFIGL
jgi:hypothetical protein